MADPRDHVGAGRYAIISKLGEGGMGAVFRAHDRLTGADVAVKRLIVKKPPSDPTLPMSSPPVGSAPTILADGSDHATHLAGVATADSVPTQHERPGPPTPRPVPARRSDSVPAMRLAIASEFRILASLRHPNIISVLDYGFDDHSDPFLVLEVLEQAHTVTSAARAQPLRVRIQYVAQILHALAYLHRRGIRHRDLKPSNVLVAGGRVRVLDFGLALEVGEIHRPAGTLGYIAPEVMRGEPHSAAADLYAAGIVAYELITGTHPFGRSEEEVLRASVRPPRLHLDDATLSRAALDALADTVDRLLQYDPIQRPSSANQALRFLARTGVLDELENDDVRKSMVSAARLVGRAPERMQLREALSRARKGQGGVVALVGESGVGKSRLVDELRTHALVSGCSVVAGREVAEGGAAYEAWQDPLRRIALEATTAAPVPWPFLTLVVPDIGELIGIGMITTPMMDPQTLQVLLMQAVEALVRAARGPTVILLEDLHWAGPESLALLGWMTRVAASMSLLVVVTTRPEGTASVSMPGVSIIELGPLERRDLEELALAVLGPLGDRADLVDLLERGTGGVPLYVVEALRLLAAQAGTLEDIGTMRLPPYLTIDVLEDALRDRLARLPGEALPLCQLAALFGPDLDLGMLEAVAPHLELAIGLDAAEQAGVLAVDVGGWHFSHERVREVLVESIPDGERAGMHRRIAEWLDQAGGDPVARARHWGLAGDRAREAEWTAAAADALLTRAAYLRARASFARALELLDERGLTGAERDRAELPLQLGRGTCALIIDGFSSPATAAAYDRAAALCESLGVAGGVHAFMVLFGQAAVHLFRGDIESSINLSQRALRVAQEANDVDLEIEGRFALSNAQFWNGQLDACEQNIQRVLALWSPERAPMHVERFGQIPRVTCMTGGAWGAWASGRPDLAMARADEAVMIARQQGHNFSEAIAVQIVAFTNALRRDVDATLMQAEALVRYGAPYPAYMILARTLRAWALAHRERDLHYLEEMRRAWADWRMIGQGAGHTLMTALLADSLLLFGQNDEALAMAREGMAWVETRHERPLLADLRCLEGRALWKQGDATGARAAFAGGAASARAIGADTLSLRVAVAWATLEYDQGDLVEARALLVPALDRMREGADTSDVKDGRALLARLEERSSRS
jgi:serine/threonine protein kinase/tetratricopeptide (TPR) repeat protein